jgi:hypothetical protein
VFNNWVSKALGETAYDISSESRVLLKRSRSLRSIGSDEELLELLRGKVVRDQKSVTHVAVIIASQDALSRVEKA